MNSSKRPVIGITGYYVHHTELGANNRVRGLPGQDWGLFSMDYIRSVEAAGGLPYPLPVLSPKLAPEFLDQVDGMLLAGGVDIDPTLYGERPLKQVGRVNPDRDRFELALARAAVEADKPVLGICRGMQLLNVALGGSLYQDLQHQLPDVGAHVYLQYPKWYPTHQVAFISDSRLWDIYGAEVMSVNSFHHQAVRKTGDGLVVTARADDGIIEGLELPENRFVVGVQWHPEMMVEQHAEQLALFKALVRASRGK